MPFRRKASPEESPGLETCSLIDVGFLLLVYFLVTSTLDPRESDLALTLPEPGIVGGVALPEFRIEISEDGRISANEELLDTDPADRGVPRLLDRLRDYAEVARLTGSEASVVLAADDAAACQRFLDVLNALADPGVGINRVVLAGFSEP